MKTRTRMGATIAYLGPLREIEPGANEGVYEHSEKTKATLMSCLVALKLVSLQRSGLRQTLGIVSLEINNGESSRPVTAIYTTRQDIVYPRSTTQQTGTRIRR